MIILKQKYDNLIAANLISKVQQPPQEDFVLAGGCSARKSFPDASGDGAEAGVLDWDTQGADFTQILLFAKEYSKGERAATAFIGESGKASARQGRKRPALGELFVGMRNANSPK
ncbi:hypothetical protein DUI87_07432 [Hirundo rustica rustica]|uniref:Uncharacterized protein n=1 Tax=Hirundo rustica rustica TaxID=333673 RepID=A0A3M0L7Q2_HIRRU|nr:hypothetical protein DUI87_07432 [Hirundo rustica rustica]